MARLPRIADPLKVTTATGETVDFDPDKPAEVAFARALIDDARVKAPAPAVSPEVMDAMRAKWQRDDDARMAQARAEFLAEHPNAYPSYVPAPVMRSKPLAEVIRMYLADKAGEITDEVMKAKARTFDGFLAFFEDDALTVAGMTKERAQLWKAGLKARKLASKTVNDHISKLAALYAWAIDHGHATANPFQGLRIRYKTVDGKTEHYDPFTDDDLKRIFAPAAYHARFGSRPDYYWLPLIALFTGARREDIGGLRAIDVATVDGVNVLFVQHGKTKDARRKIPVHPTLQALGLLDYAAAVQASGETSLFPSGRQKGGKGASAGDLFTDHLKALGMQDGRKVFHSFRATVISQLATLEAHPEHSRVIVGHKGLDIHSGVYSRGIGLQAVADTLARLSYPGLDFDDLRAPDPTFKGYLAKWKSGAAHRARLAQGRANHAAAKAKKAGVEPRPV